MRRSDDFAGNQPAGKPSSRYPARRAWGGALLAFGVVALTGGCGSDGPGAMFVDPAHYSFYRCEDLATRSKALIAREAELRGLMEKAGESPGGSVIGSFAYRSDYDTAVAEEKLVQRNAAEKNCSFASPAQFQSDQTIR
ncbi:MAG TPA: twin-arginine translocation pathway signal [Xanthobacteraceae bacterium]